MPGRIGALGALFFVNVLVIPVVAVEAGAVNSGDILAYQVGAASASGAAAPLDIVELNPSNSAANPVQTWAISDEPNPLYSVQSGVGVLSLSAGGSEVSFTGWTSNSSQLATTQGIARGVGVINAAGVYSQPASYNPATLTAESSDDSEDLTHTAFSSDGANWYFGDSAGIFYDNGAVPLPQTLDDGSGTMGNYDALAIKSFGSNTYVLHAAPTSEPGVNEYVLATAAPSAPNSGTTGVVYTHIVTIPLGDRAQDFYMVSSSNNGVYDTLYAAGTREISKFGLVNGVWESEGTDAFAVDSNINGIAAVAAPSGGVDLYVSVSTTQEVFPADSDPSSIDEITDSAASDAAFAPSKPVVIYEAPSGDELYGVSPAPTVPEPMAWGVFAVSAAGFLTRRRCKIGSAIREVNI